MPAMGLDVFLRRQMERLGRGHPGGCRGQRQIGRIRPQRPGAVVGVGPGKLQRHVHVRQLVLDRLERSDRPAKGEPFLRVFARHLQAGIRAADLLEREQDRRPVQHPLHRAPTAGTQRLNRRRVELQPRMVASRIQRLQVAPARAGQVGDEQSGLAVLVARHHHGDIGNAAIRHRPFGAGQPSADHAGMDRGGFRIAVALRQRKAADQRPIRQLRQVFPPLRIRPGGQDRLGRQIGGRPERHRRHRSPHFLGQHAQAFIAQARAAEFFRNGGADPAHLGDLAPQIGGVAFLPVQRPPHHRRRALLRQESPGLVAELLEIVGKVEIHGAVPPGVSLPEPTRCQSGRSGVKRRLQPNLPYP